MWKYSPHVQFIALALSEERPVSPCILERRPNFTVRYGDMMYMHLVCIPRRVPLIHRRTLTIRIACQNHRVLLYFVRCTSLYTPCLGLRHLASSRMRDTKQTHCAGQ